MKIILICLSLFVFAGCIDSSIDQFNSLSKPAIVFTRHKCTAWYDNEAFSVIDSKGNIIEFRHDFELVGIIDKYNIGDTIK